jgi:hypothetical protein
MVGYALPVCWPHFFFSSEHVIIYKNVVPACLQNTSGLTMASCVFLQNLHPVGRQPDANFIQSAGSQMQISSVGCQPDANFIQSATSRMQIASG